MHDRSRLLAGKILGRLALPQLRANLIPIITTEIDRAFSIFIIITPFNLPILNTICMFSKMPY